MTVEKGPYLTNAIIDAVLWVNTLFRGKVSICGSTGLVINGLLHREIHDVDCITDENWYGSFFERIGQYGINTSNSEKFEVNGVLVCCFKLIAPNGVNIDVMYRADGCKSKPVMIYGDKDKGTWGDVRVEVPESCIEVKKNYLKIVRRGGRAAPRGHVEKHQADVVYVEALLEKRRIDKINREIHNILEEEDDRTATS